MGLERKLNVYMFLFPERQLSVLIVKKDENEIRLKQVCCVMASGGQETEQPH